MICRKIYPAFLLTTFIGAVLHGQIIQNSQDLDKKYTPNSSSIFNNLLKKGTDKSSSGDIEFANGIKYFPTMLVRQKAYFSYERKLLDGFSLLIGAGKSFGNDYIQSVYFMELFGGSEPLRLTPGKIYSNSAFYESNLLLGAGARLYFSGTAFENGYAEFNFRRETLTYTLESRIDNMFVYGDRNLSVTMNNFNFGFGFSGVSGKNDNILHDFYILFGIKNLSFDSYEVREDYPGSGVNNEFHYEKSGSAFQARIIPSIHMGYAFGFGF